MPHFQEDEHQIFPSDHNNNDALEDYKHNNLLNCENHQQTTKHTYLFFLKNREEEQCVGSPSLLHQRQTNLMNNGGEEEGRQRQWVVNLVNGGRLLLVVECGDEYCARYADLLLSYQNIQLL
jgi:hypothetical protein